MAKITEAEKRADRAKQVAAALSTILKNRGRSADSIASWDILDALELTGLDLKREKW